MTLWRVFCAVVGFVAAGLGVVGILYAFTPAFLLEPNPGFEVSLALVALFVAALFLWWAFAPTTWLARWKRPH
jgi:hypothetical protein